MEERNIKNLDLILNTLVNTDSVVSINDFQDSNGNYFGFKKNEKGETHFKILLSIFDELGIANIDLNYLELTPNGSEHIRFKNNGGFKEYYNKLNIETENLIEEFKIEEERKEKQDWVLSFDRKWKKPLAIIAALGFLVMATLGVLRIINNQKPTTLEDNKVQQEDIKYNISKVLSKKEVILEKTKDTIKVKNDSLMAEPK